MRKIMAIFAHPDDESAVSGTLAHYADQGNEVMLVCATRGEAGEISDPALATRKTLGRVRQKELQAACVILGINHLEFLGYRDSGMEGTDENNHADAFVQADPDEVIGKIVALIRRYQPDVVITFEPYGWYGHPDHKMTSKWVTEAYPRAGDAGAYPDAGTPWQPQSLFHAVLPFSKFRSVIEEAIEAGYIEADAFDGFDMADDILEETESQITHRVDIRPFFDKKQDAMRAHETQFGEDNPFQQIPDDMMQRFWGVEYYIRVDPAPDTSSNKPLLSDLFA